MPWTRIPSCSAASRAAASSHALAPSHAIPILIASLIITWLLAVAVGFFAGALMLRRKLYPQLEAAVVDDSTQLDAQLQLVRQIHQARAQGQNVHGVDLSEAHLEGADLRSAGLSGARIIGTVLDNADLSGADLTAADLRRASLIGVDLTAAILDRADLRWSDLSGAKVTPQQLAQAWSLEDTMMPHGTRHD